LIFFFLLLLNDLLVFSYAFQTVYFTTSYFAALDFEDREMSKMATQKKHIEEIRRKKFSIGGNPNPLTEDLHQAVKNLSDELYTRDVHFLMELIQVPNLVTFSSIFFYPAFLTDRLYASFLIMHFFCYEVVILHMHYSIIIGG